MVGAAKADLRRAADRRTYGVTRTDRVVGRAARVGRHSRGERRARVEVLELQGRIPALAHDVAGEIRLRVGRIGDAISDGLRADPSTSAVSVAEASSTVIGAAGARKILVGTARTKWIG